VQPRAAVEARAIKEGIEVHFGDLMALCHLKNAELEAALQAYKGRIVFRGDRVKDAEGFFAVFSEQGTSASHMSGTKFLDAIARMPGNDGEDSDALGAYTQILLSEAAELLGINVLPETWITLPESQWPKDGSWDHIEKPVCPLLRNLYGHPLAGLLWDKGSQKRILQCGFEKVRGWESLYVHRQCKLFLGVYVDDFHMAGQADQLEPMWERLNKVIDLEPPVKFHNNTYLGCTQVNSSVDQATVEAKRLLFQHIQGQQAPTTVEQQLKEEPAPKTPTKKKRNRGANSAVKTDVTNRTEKSAVPCFPATPASSSTTNRIRAYEYKMIGSAKQCIVRYQQLAKVELSSLTKVATPCIDDHLLAPEDFVTKGVLSAFASKLVLKALYLARLGRLDLLWTVNTLAREVTRWTVACDKRLHRLMSYIHHTSHHVMKSYVGDNPADCKLMLFCDASFAGDLAGSKSTSGVILVLMGPNTFCPIGWIVKKQGAVSHSSSEAEVIALDAGVRLEGIPALGLWDLVIEVFQPSPTATCKRESSTARGNPLMLHNVLSNVDYVPTNVPESSQRAKLVILEDNEAVIQMCIKQRSPNMRHVHRTHRVDLDWLFERLHKDPAIGMKYVNTKQQLADILTKGSFTEATWKVLCQLIQLGPTATANG